MHLEEILNLRLITLQDKIFKHILLAELIEEVNKKCWNK
jgi:hypothetical protein